MSTGEKIVKQARNAAKLTTVKFSKYWVAVGVFLLLFLFFNEHTLFKRIGYDRQIQQLEDEIDYYSAEKQANKEKLELLKSSKENLEKLAREQYQMVKPNEELFIIRE
ncbi:hypothetical protein SAMD00024442_11_32 [Candidatus Symbiothrix dinenymphae]|nr:hypothetical protein SAMD00024442_11_32 [Candidatus Symbiothrix dinenymphae]